MAALYSPGPGARRSTLAGVATAYVELPAPLALHRHVACLWWSGGAETRVLPDACVDVVFDGEQLVVAGPQTVSRVVPATEHPYRCGVRFRVASAGAVLGLPAARLLDLNVAVGEVWNGDGRRLEDRVACAAGPRQALERLVAGLAGRIETVGERDVVIRQAAVAVVSGAPLGRVSRIVGLGERQLRRRFDDAVGFGPATLVRVQRFQRFLSLAGRQRGLTLARLAAEAGYADQSHLARECRRLSGCSPVALLEQGADAAGEKAVTRLGS